MKNGNGYANGRRRLWRDYLPIFAVAVLGALLVVTNLRGFEQISQERPSYVTLGPIHLLSDPTGLCPGDTIEFTAPVSVNRPTLILRGTQVWRVGALTGAMPAEVGYTVIAEATDFPAVPRQWTVPDLEPGDYFRDSVFVLPGQAASATGQRFLFNVREGCK